MKQKSKKTIRVLIDLPIDTAKILRQLAFNNDTERKPFIEKILNDKAELYRKKQLNLFTDKK